MEDKAYITVTGAGGGDVQIQSSDLALTQGSRIFADTIGTVPGGEVLVRTTKAVTLTEDSQIKADISSTETVTGGNVRIQTEQLSIQGDLSFIRAGTLDTIFGKTGQGGNLTVSASESVELAGTTSGLFTQTLGAGDAGNLIIDTKRLSVQNGAQILNRNNVLSQGKAGNLFVTATDLVELQGTGILSDGQQTASTLSTQTENAEPAGNLTINTRQLIVENGAQIVTGTLGQGKGGDININASDTVNIFGVGTDGTASGLFSRTNKGGQGGNIIINKTNAFRVADNGVVDARTLGDGNAGNITVNANTLEAVNGGQILANVAFPGSSGLAGNITVNATDRVTISGSATFKRRVRGIDGNLVEDESANSGLFVRSQGSKGAGNLQVKSPFIRLDNGGEITAETASGNGGDITLHGLDLLLLSDNSQISATAGTNQQGGDGGNITINAPDGFIVAKPNENSDITANAYNGNGGIVKINATKIFGIAPLTRQDLQRLL
ncbi:MAG: S-layer family protein, partial [Pyrinomonadaceae bacterium]|nr:S-layer family protein [Pyrinomonadaceae bacterium]